MKIIRVSICAIAIVIPVFFVVGCHNDDNLIVKQMADAKKQPPPKAEQIQKGMAEIEAGRDKVRAQQAEWEKAHPAEAAEYKAAHPSSDK